MDVFLIEIKGADFNLLNKGSYPGFNAKVNRAKEQIHLRHRTIYDSLAGHRKTFHHLRAAVEKGRAHYHSFAGPQMPLEVDKNKDIRVYGVVIGGRGRLDLVESRKRHDAERHSTPETTVDSWDSWLNRLRRD